MTPKLKDVAVATPEKFDAEVKRLEQWMKTAKASSTDRYNFMTLMMRLRTRLFGEREETIQ